MAFDEDACRTRDLNAAHNLALLRRLANNPLKLEPSPLSIKGKRLLCASSRSFLCSALNALNVHAQSLGRPPACFNGAALVGVRREFSPNAVKQS